MGRKKDNLWISILKKRTLDLPKAQKILSKVMIIAKKGKK